FLGSGPASMRYGRDFSSRRQPPMNRLYVVESNLTITGWTADHRWPLRATQVESFARALAHALGIEAWQGQGPAHNVPAEGFGAVVRDLREHHGHGVVLAGDGQPPLVHALAHKINQELGNTGQTVLHIWPVEFQPPPRPGPAPPAGDPVASLRELV